MQTKTVTVVIDEDGNSTIDLAGFKDHTCATVAEDFRGGDPVKKERRKPEYHYRTTSQEQQRAGR
jgi:hypothetical protein